MTCLSCVAHSLLQKATCSGGKSERFKFAEGGLSRWSKALYSHPRGPRTVGVSGSEAVNSRSIVGTSFGGAYACLTLAITLISLEAIVVDNS